MTTAAAHGLNNGDTVDIAGIAGAGANLNGARVVANKTATTFTFAAVPGVAANNNYTGNTATLAKATNDAVVTVTAAECVRADDHGHDRRQPCEAGSADDRQGLQRHHPSVALCLSAVTT